MIGHQKQWIFLKRKFEQDQLSHAYLFTGEKQLGKRTFAREFVKYINCLNRFGQPATTSSPAGEWCGGKCVNCQMIERGSFPDLMNVTSEEGQELQISKIREVQNFLSYKSYYISGIKAVIVDGAEKMNQEAQSCFLKTLEEPKGRTLLILISSMPAMLLPTISSRCQTIKFFRPKNFQPNSEKLTKEKIILSELLKVINSELSDKFKYVKSLDLEQQKIGDILEALQKYFRQLLLAKIGVGESKKADSYSISKIKRDIKLIEDINSKLLFTNANPKLALEVLLMELN